MTAIKKSVRRTKTPFFNKVHKDRETKIGQLKAKAKQTVKRARKSPRLYMKATFTSYQRGLARQNNNVALLRIDDVVTKKDALFYVGKRVAYVYHGYKQKRCVRWNQAPARRSNTRAQWGRVFRIHGTSGQVRAKFASNLPADALGKRIRVYLYPSKI